MKAHKSISQMMLFFTFIAIFIVLPLGQNISEENYEMKEIKKVYQLIADGKTQEVFTEKTVTKDILEEAQFILGAEDKVIPALDEVVEKEIQVIRVSRETVEEKRSLSFSIEKKDSQELYQGETRVLQKGKKGLEKQIYEVILEDGKEIARNLVKKIIVKEPVKQIIAFGTQQVVSRGGSTLNFKKSLSMSATGYTHTGNRTCTGIWPSVGIVAVDPKVIPLKTRLYIDGYGYATAMDTGGSIKGNRIDLFFETKKEAFKWGRRQVRVFILNQE